MHTQNHSGNKIKPIMFELKNAEGKDHRGKMMVSFTSI